MSAREHWTGARESSRLWTRALMTLLVTVAAAGWLAYVVSNLELRYEVTGSLVLADGPLSSALDSTKATSAQEVGEDPGDLSARLSRLVIEEGSGGQIDIQLQDSSLLHIRVQGANSEDAERLLDAVLELTNGASEAEPFETVFELPISAREDGTYSGGALLGLPSAEVTRALIRAPAPSYLVRVAEVQLEGEATARTLFGEDGEVQILQTAHDPAPIVDLSVVGPDPAAALAGYEAAVQQLRERLSSIQARHGVPTGAQWQLAALNQPAHAELLFETLLTPFFHAASMLFILMVIAGHGLERVARGPDRVRR